MTDTIADLLIRINNARCADQDGTKVPYSSMKEAILEVLKREGYIGGYHCVKNEGIINVEVKNAKRFTKIMRVSKPSRRLYVKSKNIPRPKSGFGIVVISTPRGVLSGEEARRSNTGGEIICEVF